MKNEANRTDISYSGSYKKLLDIQLHGRKAVIHYIRVAIFHTYLRYFQFAIVTMFKT